LLIDFNQRMVLLSRLREQEKDLRQRYGQLEATRDMLKTEIVEAESGESVERWAREEAMMIQEGDIPIVILPPSNPIPTTVVKTPRLIEEIQKWEIWQELFFGN